MIAEGDKIRLTNGKIALISEVLEANVMYVAEIFTDGKVSIDHVAHEDISSVFKETEHAVTRAV